MTILPLEKTLYNLLSAAAEYGMVLFFFYKSKKKHEKSWRIIAGHLVLLLIFLLYSIGIPSVFRLLDDLVEQKFFLLTVRLLYFFGCVYGFLRLDKGMECRLAIYNAAFYCNVYTASKVFGAAVRYIAMSYWIAEETEGIREMVIYYFANMLFTFGMTAAVRLGAKLERNRCPDRTGFLIVGIANFLLLYFKYSFNTLQQTEGFSHRISDLILYPSCAVGCTLLMLVVIENYRYTLEKKRSLEIERLTRRYEMKNAEQTIQIGNDLKQLYHDMNNHILAIKTLQKNAAAEDYTEHLLEKLRSAELLAQTGIEFLDAFLYEKFVVFHTKKVQLSIDVDLTRLRFMEATDLVSVFGNALDNALEAVEHLPCEQRALFIKSAAYSNMILIKFTNPFNGTVLCGGEDGFPETRKNNAELHGIGLTNINRAVKKYGGSVDIQIDEKYEMFSLCVLIPVYGEGEDSGH